MQITLSNIGKKFQHEWVFRNVSYSFSIGQCYAITGPNGSGKSTLMQIISGMLPASEGGIFFEEEGKPLDINDVFREIDFIAPYQELIEEFTLQEFLEFHFNFKKIKNGFSLNDLMQVCMLEHSRDKQIRNFSSGMKQRLKLALAFFSQSALMLLDEPTSNLDEVGFNWYIKYIRENLGSRTIIISSNQPQEYSFCQNLISISDFK